MSQWIRGTSSSCSITSIAGGPLAHAGLHAGKTTSSKRRWMIRSAALLTPYRIATSTSVRDRSTIRWEELIKTLIFGWRARKSSSLGTSQVVAREASTDTIKRSPECAPCIFWTASAMWRMPRDKFPVAAFAVSVSAMPRPCRPTSFLPRASSSLPTSCLIAAGVTRSSSAAP